MALVRLFFPSTKPLETSMGKNWKKARISCLQFLKGERATRSASGPSWLHVLDPSVELPGRISSRCCGVPCAQCFFQLPCFAEEWGAESQSFPVHMLLVLSNPPFPQKEVPLSMPQ